MKTTEQLSAGQEKLQRIVGALQSAQAIVKQCSSDLPIELKRASDLLEVAQLALHKATLAVWESA